MSQPPVLTPSPTASEMLATLVAGMQGDPVVEGLQAYVVGGAVRDALLGVPAGDRDWVVVGASPEQMVARQFTPVGGDFPVFLHPKTREEYALARTERKTAKGYKGFTFYAGLDVTLEQDLQRRDLTVNAIALGADGRLCDPWGGREDVAKRCLRHVGPAFAEDPVRILRLARFAARFSDFTVAPETMALCRAMVAEGEADALVPERVWREISRGLMESRPVRLFEVLAESGALARVAPEWDQVWHESDTDASPLPTQTEPLFPVLPSGLAGTLGLVSLLRTLEIASHDLPARYALVCSPVPDASALHQRLKVPVECADLARLLALWRDALAMSGEQSLPAAEIVLDRIERCDGLRKPERCLVLLRLAEQVWPSQVSGEQWRSALAAVRAVDAGAVVRAQNGQGTAIREAVRAARLAALEALPE